MAATNSGYQLPTVGNDWLFGLRDMYVVLSLKHSKPDKPMFWMSGDVGYTEYFVNCGIYTKSQIQGQIWYYNDGINAVAVPLTATAFSKLGFKIVIDLAALDSFLNREVPATK